VHSLGTKLFCSRIVVRVCLLILAAGIAAVGHETAIVNNSETLEALREKQAFASPKDTSFDSEDTLSTSPTASRDDVLVAIKSFLNLRKVIL
jgi:peroxiredoxin family protein